MMHGCYDCEKKEIKIRALKRKVANLKAEHEKMLIEINQRRS